MNTQILFDQIFSLCILPLLAIVVDALVKFLAVKKNQAIASLDSLTAQKYAKMIFETIEECVIATNQTYVNSLKEQNKFNKEEQDIAFQKTFDAILTVLNDEAKEYLNEITNDTEFYLTQKIQALVNKNKKNQ